MKEALPESLFLFEKLIPTDMQLKIQLFISSLHAYQESYDAHIIWKIDKTIGGIGGYCLPANPVHNPFPGGINRELFRPLQYARTEIDIHDIRMTARYVVQNSGLHLEAVLRQLLIRQNIFGVLRHQNTTLGKAAHLVAKTDIFDDQIIDSLFMFVELYNKSKHEVNHSEDRPRLFSAADGIVCYFSARIIGQRVLEKIMFQPSLGSYEIYNLSCAETKILDPTSGE